MSRISPGSNCVRAASAKRYEAVISNKETQIRITLYFDSTVMSHAEDFKDDFGPVRIASKEDIEKERLLRQLRYNRAKYDGLTLAEAPDALNSVESPSKTVSTSQTENLSKDSITKKSLTPRSQKRELMLSGQDELIQYLEEEKRKKPKNEKTLYLSGQEELLQYLEEEKKIRETNVGNSPITAGKSSNKKGPKTSQSPKQQNLQYKKLTPQKLVAKKLSELCLADQEELIQYLEEEKHKKAVEHGTKSGSRSQTKKPPLMFVPVEEAERLKILAALKAKKLKRSESGKLSKEKVATNAFAVKDVSQLPHLEYESAPEDLMPIDAGLRNEVHALEGTVQDFSDVSEIRETPTEPHDFLDDEGENAAAETKVNARKTHTKGFSKTDHNSPAEFTRLDKKRITAKDETDLLEGHISDTDEGSTGTDQKYSSKDVDTMRKLILSQVNGNVPLKIENTSLFPSYKEIHSIISHTIHDSESHSVLLSGPAGSGKSEIVQQALENLRELSADKFITIELSGTLHFTEQHAIREIARQLDVKLQDFEQNLEEDAYEQRAISDTFHNILATLSKLDDPTESASEKELLVRVVFVIDEIEKFTENPKQTLLYNLFELAQISKVPICILGITRNVTIRDLFEKRVKSRFSQRMVQTKKADTMEEFWQDAKATLSVAKENFDIFDNQDYAREWNDHLDQLFQSHLGLKFIIYTTFFSTKSYRQLYNQCAFPISKIDNRNPLLQLRHFRMYQKHTSCGIEAAISALAPAELLVVLAAARWIARSDTPQVNFKLAYREYTEMMKTSNMETTTLSSKTSYIDNMSLSAIKVEKKIYSAKALHNCWRFVYRIGILFDVISNNHEVNANNNSNMYRESMVDDSKMLQLDVSLEELAKLVPENRLVRRFTRL